MDYCWKCGGPMSKNSSERRCRNCGRTVQRHKNSTSIYDDSSSGGGGVFAALLGIGLFGLAVASVRKGLSEEEIETSDKDDFIDYARGLEEEEKRRKRNEWARQHRKGIAICFLVLILLMTIFAVCRISQMFIPLGYGSSYLEGLEYVEVVRLLKEAGFTNIQIEEISDLSLSREAEENKVTEVRLQHKSTFDNNDRYPSNMRITVVYHTVRLYAPPLVLEDAKGMNYNEVVEEFKKAGFINISLNAQYDIIAGWFNEDGEVKSVTINGDSKYDCYDMYRLDAEIVITYHTLRSNRPD